MEETIFKMVEALNEIISDSISGAQCKNNMLVRAKVLEQAKNLRDVIATLCKTLGITMPDEGVKASEYIDNKFKRYKPE